MPKLLDRDFATKYLVPKLPVDSTIYTISTGKTSIKVLITYDNIIEDVSYVIAQLTGDLFDAKKGIYIHYGGGTTELVSFISYLLFEKRMIDSGEPASRMLKHREL